MLDHDTQEGLAGRIILLFKNHYVAMITSIAIVLTLISYIFSTEYLSLFSIDYFSFASITDIYEIPLSKGFSIPLIILIISILMFSLLAIKISRPSHSIIGAAFIVLGLFGIIYLGFILTPKFSSSIIKSGHIERYNVYTSKETANCISIIASTSDYLFTWDYKYDRPTIISKSTIEKMEQVVPSFPTLKTNRQSRQLLSEQKEKYLKEKTIWTELLDKNCSQTVIWPEIS